MKKTIENDAVLETDNLMSDRHWYAAHPAAGDAIQAEGEAMERAASRPAWRDDGRIELLLKQSGVLVWIPDNGRTN